MLLEDGQVMIRDLVMGEGTPYEVIDFNPWNRTVRADQQSRAWNHGAWSGAEWYNAATIPMHVCVSSVASADLACADPGDMDTFVDRRNELAYAFRPITDSTENVELHFRMGSREFVMFGRPRVIDLDSAWLSWIRPGGTTATLSFEALDPIIYSGGDAGLHCETTVLELTTGGLTFPIRFPIRFSGVVTGNTLAITNAGNATTGMRVRIFGYSEQPRISVTNMQTLEQQSLELNMVLAETEFIDIDTQARTVYLNGNASRRNIATGTFPLLPRGTHQFDFSSANYSPTARAEVCWRDAWV